MKQIKSRFQNIALYNFIIKDGGGIIKSDKYT